MCARYELNKTRKQPGRICDVWNAERLEQMVWAGFATTEKLDYWTKRRGGKLVDVPAERFAERSQIDGRLIWAEVPDGQVIRGLIDPGEGKPVLKIVTRASSSEELVLFEHPRMPLLESPIYSAQLPPPEPESPQGELF